MLTFKRCCAAAAIAATGLVGLVTMPGCSSTPSGPPAAPAWVHQPARTVDSGYIVYVGTGEDYTPERAKFKAEASAIQDLANECSFAPKGTRVEDHYDYFYNGKYDSFAKIGVSFDDCEQAKQTLQPSRIQELANAEMTDQLKHYQEIEYDMPAEGGALGANPALADTGSPPGGGGGQYGGTYVAAQPTIQPAIQDDGVYFVERQQVAYAKEVVILQPTAYPAGSPASQQFVTRIRPRQTQIQQYEQTHPATRTWSNSWSGFERNPTTQLPASIPRPRGYSGGGYRQSGYRQGGQGRQGMGRGGYGGRRGGGRRGGGRRRRHSDDE